MAEVADLTKKRGQAKGFITRAETFAAAIKKDTQADILMVRLEMLEKAFLNFADADVALELLEQESEMINIENRYVMLKAKFKEHIRTRLPKQQLNNQDVNDTFTRFAEQQREFMDGLHDRSFIQREDVRLPSISIPPFLGNCADFPSFKNLFEVTIHSTTMPKIHKFKYLKGLLRDDAAALLKHIIVTEDNYEGAWEKLVQRYDKKQQIVSNLIKQFLSQPNIQGNNAKLRQLVDVTDEVLRGLEALGSDAQQRDCWIIYLLLEKCDVETRQAWALFNDKDYPTIQNFLDFLTKRVNSLETIEPAEHKKQSNKKPVVLASIINNKQCPCCSKDHTIYNCSKFISFTCDERRDLVAEKRLCFNCMGSGHQAGRCRIKSHCKNCGRRHNTLLCADKFEQEKLTDSEAQVAGSTGDSNKLHKNTSAATTTTAQLNATTVNQSILPTAVVKITNKFGRDVYCRALLDSGSQVSIIDEELANKLHIDRMNCRINISGVATNNVVSRGLATVQVGSRFVGGETIKIDVLIVARLAITLPRIVLSSQQTTVIEQLELADPSFNQHSKVQLLIGADVFINSIRDGQMDLDETLRRFWEKEELPHCVEPNDETEQAETFFKNTTISGPTGRFIVRLPFKTNMGQLGQSLETARKRFMAIERRLIRDSNLKTEYVKFMKEYEILHHMSSILKSDKNIEPPLEYYLPHHAVVKLSSKTTKVRVVFDGSSKTSSGLSLNDTLICGPVVQSSLWEILLRFRQFKYVMAADIEKMYRQIEIAETDRAYQQILWRENPNHELKRYCLNTVTYGTTSAPFLATRCLKELGLQHLNEFPEAARAIMSDFYLDDFLSGADTIDDLKRLQTQVNQILSSAGFHLRKWAYNSDLAGLQNACEMKEIDSSDGPLKLLGVRWIPKTDAFTFDVVSFEEGVITKRKFLSDASKVFDPLGWLAPSVIISKTIFQELWMLKLGWDDMLPTGIQNRWAKLHKEFQLFSKLQIPRWIGSDNIEIHGFCGASKVAYGAVVYTRRVEFDEKVITNILAAKTKVAPIKTITIPRLELCGALLLSKLLQAIATATNFPLNKMKAWTDSSVVLAYISAHPSKWKPFVANRVSEILSICPRNIWGYVKSKENPADLASRGVYPEKLLWNNLWWHGPSWLRSINTSVEEGEMMFMDDNDTCLADVTHLIN